MRSTHVVLFFVLFSIVCHTGCGRDRSELRHPTPLSYRQTDFEIGTTAAAQRTAERREKLRAVALRTLNVALKLGIAVLMSEADYGNGSEGEALEKLAISAGVMSADGLMELIFEEEK